MRFFAAFLFLALLAAGIWTFAVAPAHGWWLPPAASTTAVDVDRLFGWISWIIAFFFVLTEGLLAWLVVRGARPSSTRAWFTHGSAKLELAWTMIPGAILVSLAFLQLSTWNAIKKGAAGLTPLCEVWASQFDWRFRYPGRDGLFGTLDDRENAFELVVPAHEKVVLHLRSRDVIHSFFVPSFRLKQDVVPGSTIPVWFEATEEGEFTLICAELCGWGHYKMAGRVRVVSRAAYEAWLAAKDEEYSSVGREDVR